jgi:hypothetical protein
MNKQPTCRKLFPTFNISRDQVLNKYWELANLEPEKTKGSITGQLKALDSLCEELALKSGDKTPRRALTAQTFYRSAWMNGPGSETPS